MSAPERRLVVGISGSSAPQLAVKFLEISRHLGAYETHLVMSQGAHRSIELELRRDPAEVAALADVSYDANDMGAPISSGSFETMGMVVIPCSMRTLAAVATGNSDNLVARAADVTLKERRRLVLVARETPLNLIHIENMRTVTLAGGTILPPVMAFYHQPQTIDDLLAQTCGKVIDQFGVPNKTFRRWGS
ncbi:MAG: 2,5-furandicarboxylate decarboxylase 2 [Mycobacterium sp.]|jgi:polyprenyl P-hydroxybenzoate/phenylacrylic acid decarboxylase-like protein|nr:2,5-furandicarboxylate decarboxylase 2 [Mycobacterium sp.]